MDSWVLEQGHKTHNDLKRTQSPICRPEAGNVQVKVHAVSLNPVDYKLAAWGHPAFNYPHILGLDVAGIVSEVGEGVNQFIVGDRVYFHSDLRRPGGFAEYIVVVAHSVSKIPDAIDFITAASIPCAGFTAWQAIYDRLRVAKGQTVLVTGAAGGVGNFATQILHHIGATVIGTASSEKHEMVKRYGADFVIDYKTDDITQKVLEFTKGKKLDAVVDTVSPESAADCLSLLKYGGGLAAIGGRPEWKVPPFTISPSIHEISLGASYSYGDFEAQKRLGEIGEELIALVASGHIKPFVSKVISFDDIPAGLEELSLRRVVGKIVVDLSK